MGADDAERALLTAIEALVTGQIDRGTFVESIRAWREDPTIDLARSLGARMTAARRPASADSATSLAAEGPGTKAYSPQVRSWAVEPEPGELTKLGESDADLDATISPEGSGDPDPSRSGTANKGAGAANASRFQVVRPYARGGLGVVFVAVDTELNREVALKRIETSRADDSASRSRFLLEAEITAGLEHPGIVPVYGLGDMGDGRPYYAMRFIRGESLQQAIKRFHGEERRSVDPGARSLALRKLLGSFVDVCNAVDFAHGRGVLHRDLKPANVIIGRHGETLVVDWGLAKVMGNASISSGQWAVVKPHSVDLNETIPGSTLGTPNYMSPEQSLGIPDALGPRSDVYSLGVTLYCILTGRAPFEGQDLSGLMDSVRRGDFLRPSLADRSVPKALEAVCLKAMALRIDDRYPSARALADDIERWMADEPVSARREPFLERARRWSHRNRTTVTATAVGLAIALGAMSLLAWTEARSRDELKLLNHSLTVSKRSADRARRQAEEGFAEARRAVDESLTRIAEDERLGSRGLQPLRKELLASAQRFYEKFLAERGGDSRGRLDLARANMKLGEIEQITEGPAAALKRFDGAVKEFNGLLHDHPGEPVIRTELANAWNSTGSAALDLGRLDRAIEAYSSAAALLGDLVRDRPEAPNYRARLARTLSNLGIVHERLGKSKESLQAHERSIALREALLKENPARDEPRVDLAESLLAGSRLYFEAGEPDRAFALTRRGCDLLEPVVSANPDTSPHADTLARGLADLGYLHRQRGERNLAFESYSRSRGLYARLVDQNPQVDDYKDGLGHLENMRSDLLRELGRYDEAAEAARSAGTIFEAIASSDGAPDRFVRGLAKSQDNLGRLLAAKGKTDEALAAFQRAIAHSERLRAAGPIDLYNRACDRALAIPLMAANDPEREATARRALIGLRRAIDLGMRYYEQYARDPDLDALRHRPDFRLLLLDLAFPDDPFEP